MRRSASRKLSRWFKSYGKLLALKNGTGGHKVLDSGSLSHPKPIIKQSLLLVIKSSEDPAERKALSAAFVLLADFQQRDIVTGSGTAGAAGRDEVHLERLSLTEELKQAGYGL